MDRATINAYDLAAASFASDWEEDQSPPIDLQTVVRQYFKVGPTADIGCGSGRDTAWLCENGYPTVGVDPSVGLLEEASRRHPAIRFQSGALPELDGLVSGSFENVLCETVVMHLDTKVIAPSVRRLCSLLKNGGTLYLSWRVTNESDRRDEYGRLYSAFEPALIRKALSGMRIELDEELVSASSKKVVHRIIARKE